MILTDIDGVFATGIHCGIKASGNLDLGYIFVPHCTGSAMVLSQNQIRSATIDHNATIQQKGPVKVMIINSGNANSVTGPTGVTHVNQTAQKAADVFGCLPHEVGVASTGIIGVPLPIQTVLSGIDAFTGTEKNGDACASAILTTDLVKKTAHRTITIQGESVHFCGITKGSGMIAPNMATTLGFIVTNLGADNATCSRWLKTAIDASYNMLSVDTDQSTNDMVSLQCAGTCPITPTPDDDVLIQQTLTDLCIDLAKQIAKDGEGATHTIEATVSGAVSLQDARRVAKLVIDSPLVKTAIAGEDPNWGRLLMAIGKDPEVTLEVSAIQIQINNVIIFKNGQATQLTRDDIRSAMNAPNIAIHIVIGHGDHSATAWGCDLTHGYIDINTQYN